MRFELVLLSLSLTSWGLVVLQLAGLFSLAGSAPVGLYGLYSLAVALGWVGGNLYVHRARRLPRVVRRRMLWIYVIGPPGALFLLRSMAPLAQQVAAPLAATYAFGVYVVLFLVPVSFRKSVG